MTREKEIPARIALLATGDEICQGNIMNSNSQEIALRLTNEGIQVRMHMVAPDSISEIEQAIQHLLNTHKALIITGGLGPTSDDLTRFALSKAIQRPLLFNEINWEMITNRLKRLGYPTPPESNRQQALFPEHSSIIDNPNGTAAGCMVEWENKLIFMLPGPPSECLPMLDTYVLPALLHAGFGQIVYRKKWLLLGVSEGKIAEELDQLAKPYASCITGYRLCYPYLEFKLYSNHQADIIQLSQLIEKQIAPYTIMDGQEYASTLLQIKLQQANKRIGITDFATGGLLEATLLNPATFPYLTFGYGPKENIPWIEILGLTEFWQSNHTSSQTTLAISFTHQGKHEYREIKISLQSRLHLVKLYAVELTCAAILKYFTWDKLPTKDASSN